MGRKGNWPNQDILLGLYKRYGSADQVAKAMKIHPHTVRKYLKLYGSQLQPGPERGKRRWSAFADWLKRNPDDVLPPSVKEIADITGVSKDSIKSYLWRLRKESKSFVSTQPWKGGKTALWIDTLNAKIPDVAFSNVRTFIGLTGRMKFVVRLKDGTAHIFRMSLADLKSKYA